MLPVVEGNKGLLFYPVQYEGLEASKNIYYTGATTNQQIIPAMDFLKSKGVKTLFLAGSDYVFPRTANKIIKQYAKELGIEIVGEEYRGGLGQPIESRRAAGILEGHDQPTRGVQPGTLRRGWRRHRTERDGQRDEPREMMPTRGHDGVT